VNGDFYKKLGKAIQYHYVIGSYQRGYRWDAINVKELLGDIFEGRLVEDIKPDKKPNPTSLLLEINNKTDEKVREREYCLQPIVLKKIDEETYSIIDGQQRLTTLYIILKTFSAITGSQVSFPQSFSIRYDTRVKLSDFLADLNDDSTPTDIDTAYIKKAYDTAKEWLLAEGKRFNEYLDNQMSGNLDPNRMVAAYAEYLIGIMTENTKFIWDEVDESSADSNKQEQKIFADRNSGKLELTDSELIKALFMNPTYYGKNELNISDRQTLISEIWDIYENELHKEEFWSFLPLEERLKEKFGEQTRIDAVFWMLMHKKNISVSQYEENALFKAVRDWVDKDWRQADGEDDKLRRMTGYWREVCELMDGMKELFENNELYNLLSLYKRMEDDAPKALSLYLDVLGGEKRARAKKIKASILAKLKGQGNSNSYNNIEDLVKHTKYPNRQDIRNILMAQNVAITNQAIPISRFAFRFFEENNGDYKWELEHIYSTNEGYIEKLEDEKKIEILKLFCETERHQNYIEYLHGVKFEEEKRRLGVTEDADFMNKCFEKSNQKYDMYFDIWKVLRLKILAQEYVDKYELFRKLQEIIDGKDTDFDQAAASFLSSSDYDDNEVFKLLRGEYLYWDDQLEREYQKRKGEIQKSGQLPNTITWYGLSINIPDPNIFWNANRDERRIEDNFIRNYYRRLLHVIYDNTGISNDYLGFSNHGPKREKGSMINDGNRELVMSFLKGTNCRIKAMMDQFFSHVSINSMDYEKGISSDYQSFAVFLNDNSMGNMMYLQKRINDAGAYRNTNFNGKRRYVAGLDNVFLPVATSQVIMGKYIDLESSTEQWLMGERRAYLEDMIKSLQKYYEEK